MDSDLSPGWRLRWLRVLGGLALAVLGSVFLSGRVYAQSPTATPVGAGGSNGEAYDNACELGSGELVGCSFVGLPTAYQLGYAVMCHQYDTLTSNQAWDLSDWTCYRVPAEVDRDPNLFEDGAVQLDWVLEVPFSASGMHGDRYAFYPPGGAVAFGLVCQGVATGGNVGSFTAAGLDLGGPATDTAQWHVTASQDPCTDYDMSSCAISRAYSWVGPGAYAAGAYDGAVGPQGVSNVSVSFGLADRYIRSDGFCRGWWRYDDSLVPTPTPTIAPPTLTPGPLNATATAQAGATATANYYATALPPWCAAYPQSDICATLTPQATPEPPGTGTPWPTSTATRIPDFAATLLAGWPTAVNTPNFATMEALLAGIGTSVARTATATATGTATRTPVPIGGAGFDAAAPQVEGQECITIVPDIGTIHLPAPPDAISWVNVGDLLPADIGFEKVAICGRPASVLQIEWFGINWSNWFMAMMMVGAAITTGRWFMNR